MRPTLTRLCLATGLAFALATSARAVDTVQFVAPIVALRINSNTADEFPVFHGFIMVGDSIGGYARYEWGGSHCFGGDLTEAQVAALEAAMNNPRLLIEPRTQNGQGSIQCLAAFSFVLRSDTGAL